MIRNIRYRRDQRQLEEEEEIWFNEEDDFSDVVPTSKADIETYSKHSPEFDSINKSLLSQNKLTKIEWK